MWLVATLLDSSVKCTMSLALTLTITGRSEILHFFPNQIFGIKKKKDIGTQLCPGNARDTLARLFGPFRVFLCQ